MAWLKKKEKVPELPSASTLPEIPVSASSSNDVSASTPTLPEVPKQSEAKGLPDLPSFPVNAQTNTLNQEMVKSAVSDISSGENEETTGALEGLHVEEIGELPSIPSIAVSAIPEPPKRTPKTNDMKPSMEIPETPKAVEFTPSMDERAVARQSEPIFVRIDKFQAAQKDFEVIKDKIKEIETILRKIKDVKSKEEQELNSWSEDIGKLKSRLAEIDSNVFSQM